MPDRSPPRLAPLGGLAAVLLVLTVLVMGGATAGPDQDASLWIQGTIPQSWHDALMAASVPVDGWNGFLWAGALILLAGLTAGRGAALFVAVVGTGAVLLNTAAKWIFDRPRPTAPIEVMVTQPASPSFPSGHVVFVAGFVGAVAWLWARNRPKAARRMVVWALVLVVGLMALSRVYLGQHFLTDTVGGALVGLGAVLAGATVADRRSTGNPPR